MQHPVLDATMLFSRMNSKHIAHDGINQGDVDVLSGFGMFFDSFVHCQARK